MISGGISSVLKPHEVENEKIRCLVEERLSLTRRERAETRDKLAEIDANIKRHGDSIYAIHPHPQSARVFYNANKAQYYSYTLSGIEDEERKTAIDIRKLENLHATTPQSNQLERQFMRDMERLRLQRRALSQCAKIQGVVDELRDRKSCLQQFLREKENLIDELSNGLRRVLTAISLNCHTSDVVEQEYVYSLPMNEIAGVDFSDVSKSYNNNVSSLMGRIVGKGGSNVHGIESQFKVSIDVNSLPYSSSGDLSDSVVRLRILVMGNKYQQGIEQAYAALVAKIESVRDTTIELVAIGSDALACLTIKKRKRLSDLQAKHPNVQFDLRFSSDPSVTVTAATSSAKGKTQPAPQTAAAIVRLSGFLDAVNPAKKDILAVQLHATHAELDVSEDPKILGVLLSSRPSNATAATEEQGESDQSDRPTALKAIEDDCDVNINVSRESLLLEIRGLKEGVAEASQRLKDIIYANKEVEETMQLLWCAWFGCVFARNGDKLRILTKFLGVKISEESMKKTEKFGTIKIKGTYTKVHAAMKHINSIVEQHMSDTACIELKEQHLVPIILGKNGAGIKSIREKYPTAEIDMDSYQSGEHVIYVHSNSAETVRVVRSHLESIIEANFEAEYKLTEDCAIQLKSQKGTATRNKIIQDLGLMMYIDKSNRFLKLRGLKPMVASGLQILREFCDSFLVAKIPYLEEDYLTMSHVFKGPDGKEEGQSVLKKIEVEHDVDISASRKELYLRVQGAPVAVAAAVKAIQNFIAGDANSGSIVIDIGNSNSVSAALIGKSGANIKKIEEEFKVKCDLNQSRKTFRICGSSSNAQNAKTHVLSFIDNLKVSEPMQLSAAASLTQQESDAILKLTSDIFGVEIVQAKSTAAIGTAVDIKGPFAAVQEAKAFLSSRFARIDQRRIPLLQKSSFDRLLQGIAISKKDSISLKQIQSKYSSVEIIFSDTVGGCYLELKGPEGAVSQAFAEVLSLVESVLRLEFAALRDFSVPFLHETINSQSLREVREKGVRVEFDRVLGHVYLAGPQELLPVARSLLMDKFAAWTSLNAALDIEEFMVPLIVGKNGSNIRVWTDEAKVALQVNKRLLKLEIKGTSAEVVTAAQAILAEKIEKLRKQHWELAMDAELVGIIIGKQGAVINKIRQDSGAHIEIDAVTRILKVSGKESAVAQARELINILLEEYQLKKPLIKVVAVPIAAYSTLIGTKGSKIREIEAATSIRLDIDRYTGKCTLKGSEKDIVDGIALINKVLEENKFPASSDYVEPEPAVAVSSEPLPIEPVKPQPKPVEKQLSKSALRRKKREASKSSTTAAATSTADDEDEEGGDADENEDNEDVVHVPVDAVPDSKVLPAETEGYSIDTNTKALHDEADSDASATAAETGYEHFNSSFLGEGLPVVLNSLSGDTSTESYNSNLGIVSNSESAQSWQLMNLLIGNEQPTDAKEMYGVPFSTFDNSAHGNRLDLAYPGFQLSSLMPSSNAQPSPPGPPPGFFKEPTASLQFPSSQSSAPDLGLGLGLGLDLALDSSSQNFNGFFQLRDSSSYPSELDLLLSGATDDVSFSAPAPAAAAGAPGPAPNSSNGSRDYFKSKSGLLIRL